MFNYNLILIFQYKEKQEVNLEENYSMAKISISDLCQKPIRFYIGGTPVGTTDSIMENLAKLSEQFASDRIDFCRNITDTASMIECNKDREMPPAKCAVIVSHGAPVIENLIFSDNTAKPYYTNSMLLGKEGLSTSWNCSKENAPCLTLRNSEGEIIKNSDFTAFDRVKLLGTEIADGGLLILGGCGLASSGGEDYPKLPQLPSFISSVLGKGKRVIAFREEIKTQNNTKYNQNEPILFDFSSFDPQYYKGQEDTEKYPNGGLTGVICENGSCEWHTFEK